MWGLSRLQPDARPRFDCNQPEQVKALLDEARSIGHMMAEPFSTIVAATEPETTFVHSARDKKPFPHDKTPKGVLFVGDSNHAVSPFAGNGANLALKDGWDLAAQLCQGETLESAVAAYDKLAVPRAIKTVKTSHQRIRVAHSTELKYYFFRAMYWFGSWILWLPGK